MSAGGAEALAPKLASVLYGIDKKDVSTMTAEQKQTISAIISLGGTAVGAGSGSVTDMVASGEAGRVAVEENFSVVNFNGFDKATKAKLLSCQQSANISTIGKYNIQGLTNNKGKSYEGFVLINPKGGNPIILLPHELVEFRAILAESPQFFNYYMTKIENTSNTEHIFNSPNQDGFMGKLRDSWSHYIQTGEIVMDVAGVGLGKVAIVGGKVVAKDVKDIVENGAERALLNNAGRIDLTTGKPILNLSGLTTAQKGTMGELFGENLIKQIIPNGKKLSSVQTIGSTV